MLQLKYHFIVVSFEKFITLDKTQGKELKLIQSEQPKVYVEIKRPT